ncbi:MAG TPA: hypothetical protein VH268_10690 [Solirubrobacterales bacterium]|jgi:hypothetical protein|nr:hypothetical protein [Solirubrobacterales bacterium]
MPEAERPEGQGLITRENLLAAIRSAPWTVWAGTMLLLAQQVTSAILHPKILTLVLLPIGFLFAAIVLAGVRVFRQLALVIAAGDVVFAFAPDNTIWSGAIGAGALILLLLPVSRRYFRPGRTWPARSAKGA